MRWYKVNIFYILPTISVYKREEKDQERGREGGRERELNLIEHMVSRKW